MELCYFMEADRKILFAYGSFCEFFEMYDGAENSWKTSPISYSEFLHSCRTTDITRREAYKITGGNLPEKAYEEYRKLFR